MSIAILGETLSYLRFNCIWPTKDQELNPDKYYHVKLVLMLLSSPIILIGSTLHLIVSLKCKYHFVPAKYQKRFRSKLQQHQRRLDHDDRRGRGLLLHRDIRRVPEANRADLRRLIGFYQLRKTTKFRQGEQKVVALVEDVQIVHRLCHYKRLFVAFRQQEVLREAEPRKRVQRDLRFVGHNLDALQYRRFPHQANFLSFATLHRCVYDEGGGCHLIRHHGNNRASRAEDQAFEVDVERGGQYRRRYDETATICEVHRVPHQHLRVLVEIRNPL
jgi:hypothetical protein